MARYDKAAWTAADAIHDRLRKGHQGPCSLRLPVGPWLELDRLLRQISYAGKRGWQAARRRLWENLQGQVERLQTQLNYLLLDVCQRLAEKPPLGTAEIYRDLVALKRDSSEVTIDLDRQEVVVATEPIVLEGIPLGPFEIQLDYRALDLAYRVVPLQPYPASGREDVTHPHVQDDQLCEGEGRVAIRTALEEGRLGDFFLIVSQILATYAAGQAYVELADWEGVISSACGLTIAGEDRYFCEHCNTPLCSDCYVLCPQCNLVCCSDCTEHCDGCQDSHCQSCLETCPDCGKLFCRSCREEDHQKHCENRHAAEDSQETLASQEASLAPAPCPQ